MVYPSFWNVIVVIIPCNFPQCILCNESMSNLLEIKSSCLILSYCHFEATHLSNDSLNDDIQCAAKGSLHMGNANVKLLYTFYF